MRNALQRNVELMKSFHSAKSLDKKFKLFEKMEKLIPESDLGIECWNLAGTLFHEGRSPEQVLSFGNRALRIFINNENTDGIPFTGKTRCGVPVIGKKCKLNHNSSFYIACVCHLLAIACFQLKRYDESLSYLNWGNRNLCKLLEDGDCVNNCLSGILAIMLIKLSKVKVSMGGKWEEIVVHIRKALEIMETIMEKDCIQIGEEYERLLAAYLALENYEEALPCCLRALEIYEKHFGSCSVEAAYMMSRLVIVYRELGEREKALETNQLSQIILKGLTPDSDSPQFLNGEYRTSCILFGLGRYEEAIDVLKRVVSHANTYGNTRGLAFGLMADALLSVGKRTEAKKHLKTAQGIFERKGMLPSSVAIGFEYISALYEKINDFGKATALLRRALSIPEIPPKNLANGSARLFSLISLSDKEKKVTPYMEDVLEKLKEKFGAEHCEVGYGYRNLGAVCLKSGQEELAVKLMVKAKNILDVALGPHHLDSLKTSQTLAEIYATLKSYDLSIEIQEKVAEGFKGLGPSEQKKFDEAVSLLRKMKVATAADSEDLPVDSSKCWVSEDER